MSFVCFLSFITNEFSSCCFRKTNIQYRCFGWAKQVVGTCSGKVAATYVETCDVTFR